MFDGSFKSRRTIDLSSGGRGRRKNNKRKNVLEEARALREERRLVQERHNAATGIQQLARSHQAKRRISQQLEAATSTATSPRLEWIVSMRLSPQLQPFLTVGASHLLMDYYAKSKEVVPSVDSQDTYFSRLRILRAALQELRPTGQHNLLPLIQRLLPSTKLNIAAMVDLMECCQSFMDVQEETAMTLWNEICHIFMEKQQEYCVALLAVTALCTKSFPAILDTPYRISHEWFETTAVPSLMRVLSAQNDNYGGLSIVQQALQNTLAMRESVLLTNLLQLKPSAGLCTFVQHVLNQRPDLWLLVSLVVLGEDVRKLSAGKQNLDTFDTGEMQDLTSSDEEASEAELPLASRRIQSSTSQLTRRDLMTVPKLDRLYHDNLSKQRKLLLEAKPANELVELSTKLGNPNLWLEWGNAIFSSGEEEERKAYVLLLHSVLQATSGVKTRAQSAFLSQIAFHRGLALLGGLWESLTQWSDELLVTAATTVFCDLFAHHLLVLADEEFLRHYTGASKIDATKVISHLATVLYQVYWARPSVAADFEVAFHTANVEVALKRNQARLMLSGTKLWNSLYERWCRLVRHSPFCDESVWWFPRLTPASRDSDGVVGSGTLHDGVVPMDIDEEESNDALASSFRDPKMARVLTCIPQALPFERRVRLFSKLLEHDKLKTQNDEEEFRRALMRMAAMGRDVDEEDFGQGRERVDIRRDVLYNDSLDKLNQLGPKLKKKVQVSFINQHGAREAGIDGGGVFKEFLDDLIREAFDPHQQKDGAPQLFSVTPLETLAVNTSVRYDLTHYEFLGRVLGKAVYESILVEPQFCLPFLNQLLGKQNTLDDLKNFDAEYYNNLIKLRNLNAGELDSLGLTFELTSRSGSRELMPGGAQVGVTKQNVIQYVHLVAHSLLNVDGARQTRAFLKGFRDLVPASWVRLFSSNELSKLISGNDAVRGIDVPGMKACVQYAAGYHPSQPIVQWFWEVVEDMTPNQQEKFLKFMTSCSRQPLLGFGALEPAPCIQQLRLPDALFVNNENNLEALSKVTPLPTSATCMNLLKLPNYRNKELLKLKLLQAIESGAGFELT